MIGWMKLARFVSSTLADAIAVGNRAAPRGRWAPGSPSRGSDAASRSHSQMRCQELRGPVVVDHRAAEGAGDVGAIASRQGLAPAPDAVNFSASLPSRCCSASATSSDA